MYKIPAQTTLIHIDVDPIELSRNYPAAVAIISDARLGLEALSNAFANVKLRASAFEEWRKQIAAWRADWIREAEALTAKTGAADIICATP